jgi:hypothetical protein
VFPPLDNLARYWFEQYRSTRDSADLGPVMHAIQDAGTPHHAAGYNGNWHERYEADVRAHIAQWLTDPNFADEIWRMVDTWRVDRSSLSKNLGPSDWGVQPSIGWRIDFLATWVALNSYRAYSETYQHFQAGYRFDEESAKSLTKLALAMCVLVLWKALDLPVIHVQVEHEHEHEHPHEAGDHHHHSHSHPHSAGTTHHHTLAGEPEAHHEHAHGHPHDEPAEHHHPHGHPHKEGTGHHHPY